MAGQWIKFDVATSDKPEVWAMATELDIDPDAVVGKLMRVWAWFDDQTEDGNAPSVTTSLLDRRVGVAGFCQAMVNAGWMILDGDRISLPNFEAHNGETAKKRALNAKRAARFRGKSNAESNADIVTESVTDALPREEKRREESKSKNPPKPPEGFDEFWARYPKRVGKGAAERAWKKLRAEDRESALGDLQSRPESDPQWLKDGGQFVPNPATYLNQKRWCDDWQPARASPFSETTRRNVMNLEGFVNGH